MPREVKKTITNTLHMLKGTLHFYNFQTPKERERKREKERERRERETDDTFKLHLYRQ